MKREFSTLAIERIWGEWYKWSTKSTFPSKGLIALKDSGWISFFPEINSLVRLPQDPEWHPEGDVFVHTLHCLDALVEFSEWNSYSDSQRSVLMFGVLCHDLARLAAPALRKNEVNSAGLAQDTIRKAVGFRNRF